MYKHDEKLDNLYICSGCFKVNSVKYAKQMNLSTRVHVIQKCVSDYMDSGDLFGLFD